LSGFIVAVGWRLGGGGIVKIGPPGEGIGFHPFPFRAVPRAILNPWRGLL
jgi:hypothetical protein